MAKKIGMNITNNTSTSRFLSLINKDDDRYSSLSLKEEKKMINDNINNREKINELLILHNMKLVTHLCKKYNSTSFDYDEMIASGMEGLTIAATRFNIKANTKFSTYAAFWIRKYILKQFYDKHNSNINSKAISINNTFDSSDESKTTFENIINSQMIDDTNIRTSPLEIISNNNSLEIYKNILNHIYTNEFDDIDKKIFEMYFINRLTLNTISKHINKSIAAIVHRKTKILKQLKNILSDKYNIYTYTDI